MATKSEIQQTRELDRNEWASFFEDLNRELERGLDLEATIELNTDQFVGPEVVRLPLAGITYEDVKDEITVGVGGRGRRFPAVLWHFVAHPEKVWALEEQGELRAIAIQSKDGTRTLVSLRPAPSAD